ncbi:MAG: hypothetical protein OXT65_12965 [Alphaproteobacteria bacterium]|nr:hypothetical protein [Alphaproteobacteria bacterium]
MTIANTFLLLLFILSIAKAVAFKTCSDRMDARTTPLIISAWSLLAAVVTIPVFGHLWGNAQHIFMQSPSLLFLCLAKGGILYIWCITSQKLVSLSLSSRIYMKPMATGLIAGSNYFLGERLSRAEWISALALFALSALFFFKGHISDVDRKARVYFVSLVGMSVVLSGMDHVLVSHVNWYALLIVSNVMLLGIGLCIHHKNIPLLKSAYCNKLALAAGCTYAVAEHVKFYQMVTINPVTTIAVLESLVSPVLMVLSAALWKERTVREQLSWGMAVFVFVAVPVVLR